MLPIPAARKSIPVSTIAFAKATRKFAAEYEANEAEYDKKKLFDPRKFLKSGFEAFTEAVEERIDVFGSEGKA